MGLFDNIKNVVSSATEKAVDGAINQIKSDTEETIKQEVKEKAQNAFVGGIKNYLNNAEEKITNQDGKEAVNTLQNLVDDAVLTQRAEIKGEDVGVDYQNKTLDDLSKLGEIADRHNPNVISDEQTAHK